MNAVAGERFFTAAIIPKLLHTFHRLKPGDRVNVEYDVLEKYVQRIMAGR